MGNKSDTKELMTLDEFLGMRQLGDLDLQAATEILHVSARVFLGRRDRVARLLARFAQVVISEAEARGLVLVSKPPQSKEAFPGPGPVVVN